MTLRINFYEETTKEELTNNTTNETINFEDVDWDNWLEVK